MIEHLLEIYYEGRENESKEPIESVKTYSPSIENLIYILGLADTQAEIAVRNFTISDFSYAFMLYNTARMLAKKIRYTDLEKQICNRAYKQLSQLKKFDEK